MVTYSHGQPYTQVCDYRLVIILFHFCCTTYAFDYHSCCKNLYVYFKKLFAILDWTLIQIKQNIISQTKMVQFLNADS